MPQNSAPSHDETPPANLPVRHSQPEFLAAIAILRGMQPQDSGTARVLEVECKSGQNLIPLAERSPDGTFLGIDGSARHVAAARKIAADIGLTNIEFRQQGIGELDSGLGVFDYIVADGVYSRAVPAARDKLLAVCHGHLAPQGLAFVSYRTYPGWHLHDMFRATMLYDSRGAQGNGPQRAAARSSLEFLNASLVGDEPYKTLVRGELAWVLRHTNDFLGRQYMEAMNHPVYFSGFVAHARSHALQQLGDAVLGIRPHDELAPGAEEQLAEIATDPVQREQYRDIVRNRAVREAVLCHGDIRLNPAPSAELLARMYLEGQLTPENPGPSATSAEVERFIGPGGVRVSTAVPLIKAALAHFGAIWPNYILFADLVAASCAAIEAGGGQADRAATSEIDRLGASLLECCAGGVIDVHSHGQSFTTQIAPRPIASPLARWQLEHGDSATNRKHRTVRLEHVDQYLIRMLDGTRDGAQLVNRLTDYAADGHLQIWDGNQRVQDPRRVQEIVAALLPHALARLAHNAFLIG
jgi:methyltransferase-like protein